MSKVPLLKMTTPEDSGTLIPVIDISGYLNGNAAETRTIAVAIDEACRRHGCFQLTGHGIPRSNLSRLLERLQAFFALPDDAKLALKQEMRGYQAPRTEKGDGHRYDDKEGYFVGQDNPEGRFLQAPNVWPDEAVCPGFREAMESYFDAVRKLSVHVLRLIAMGLQIDEQYFDDLVESNDCEGVSAIYHGDELLIPYELAILMVRGHKYNATSPDDGEDSLPCGAHRDFTCITFVQAEGWTDPGPSSRCVVPIR